MIRTKPFLLKIIRHSRFYRKRSGNTAKMSINSPGIVNQVSSSKKIVSPIWLTHSLIYMHIIHHQWNSSVAVPSNVRSSYLHKHHRARDSFINRSTRPSNKFWRSLKDERISRACCDCICCFWFILDSQAGRISHANSGPEKEIWRAVGTCYWLLKWDWKVLSFKTS